MFSKLPYITLFPDTSWAKDLTGVLSKTLTNSASGNVFVGFEELYSYLKNLMSFINNNTLSSKLGTGWSNLIFPEDGLLGSVGEKLTTVVLAGIPTPSIVEPISIPPNTPSIAILVLAAPGVWLPSTKAIEDWFVILSIFIVSITLTATASDSLYKMSISFNFKASRML